jgi:hypothetical protein
MENDEDFPAETEKNDERLIQGNIVDTGYFLNKNTKRYR